MNTYTQPGNILTLTAPAGGVVAGSAYKIGQLFVVAVTTIAAGLPFEGQVVGVFTLPKTSAQAWTEGALIYWDPTPGECTTATTAANVLIGVAAAAAVNPSATGSVRLNGSAVADL